MKEIKTEKSTLINGDCIEYLKNIKDESIDLIITDPPYLTTKRGNIGGYGGIFSTELSLSGKLFKENNINASEYLPHFYRILKDGSHCYIMTNHKNLQNFLNIATENKFKFIKSLIWNKGNKITGQYYMSQFEYILFFRKGKGVKINNCGTSDILNVPNILKKQIHPTEKPIELMKILIENSSKLGDVVLDPFMGIGSTGLAAINLKRKFIGVELDKEYFEYSNKRFVEYEKNIT